jgi:deoxyribonuclease-4
MLNIGIATNTENLSIPFKMNSIQIMFSSHPEKDFNKVKLFLKSQNFKNVFIHSSFKINIAEIIIKNNNGIFSNSLHLLKNEIHTMKRLNINNIVLHTGINTQRNFNALHVFQNMKLFIENALNFNINIFLETSCEKNEMLSDLNDFVKFILIFQTHKNYDKLFVCIDTCHIFSAGYDINKKKVIKKVHNIFKPIEDKIQLIHLNDSFYKCNSKKDRHANIGEGYIKPKNLIAFIKKYKNATFILETDNNFNKQFNLVTF